MLHLRLRVPEDLTDRVVDLLCDETTVTNVSVASGAFRKPAGSMVTADVAREGGDRILHELRRLDLHHSGSITITDPGTILSDEATRVERAAPGLPDDGLVWDELENRVRRDSSASFVFFAFLTLATLIAGAGRLLDQPILIVGAMVVSPEFSPVAAICVGLARPRPSLVPRASLTLLAGIVIAILVATPVWAVAYHAGAFTQFEAGHGELTDFIVKPDVWSLVIALLAGAAGTLSLTTAKSGPLVGVFISITTVPAIGAIALCLGSGVYSEVLPALAQLGINLAGIVVAGTATLLAQKVAWRFIARHARR